MDDATRNALLTNVDAFYKYAQSHHVRNYWIWVVLVSASLVLVAATTLVAFYCPDQRLAGVLSIANGLVIAVQAAFAFGDSAQFYRTMASQAQVLMFDVQAGQTEEELKKLRSDYRTLVEKLGRDVPIGTGMAAASGITGKKS